VCEVSAVHRDRWPFESADGAIGIEVHLLVDSVPSQPAGGERPTVGYVFHGGMAPEEDDVWEITDAHLSQWAEEGPWVMTGELVCGKVLSFDPRGVPRTAKVNLRGVTAQWSPGVAARVQAPFLLRKIPALATWPQADSRTGN